MSHQISPAPCELVLKMEHSLAWLQVLVQLWQHLLLRRKMMLELELIPTVNCWHYCLQPCCHILHTEAAAGW